jgi:hypothetical protein
MGLKPSKDSIDLGIITAKRPAMLAFYRGVLGLEHQGDMPMPRAESYTACPAERA